MSHKIYVVWTTKGSWDTYSDIVIGVFNDPMLADEAKRKYIAELDGLKAKYSPEQQEKLDDECEDYRIIADYPKHLKEFHDWQYRKEIPQYSLHVFVDEYTINETKFKF